jgi:hypothetical protein
MQRTFFSLSFGFLSCGSFRVCSPMFEPSEPPRDGGSEETAESAEPLAGGAPTKTPSSNRVMPRPDSVGEALAVHLERFGTGPDGLVFTSATGAPLRRSTWGKAYKAAAAAAGVDSSTHDLRHHCASVLISSGVSIKSVQRYLGHKNASETLDTYGHLMPGDDDRLRSAIDVALRGNVHGMCTEPSEGSAI